MYMRKPQCGSLPLTKKPGSSMINKVRVDISSFPMREAKQRTKITTLPEIAAVKMMAGTGCNQKNCSNATAKLPAKK